jgi:hypothetical protein
VIQDYKDSWWFYEIVEYGRKLIFTGVMGFIAPGSLSQLFLSMVIAALFIAANASLMPFRDVRVSVLRVCGRLAASDVLMCGVHENGFELHVLEQQ